MNMHKLDEYSTRGDSIVKLLEQDDTCRKCGIVSEWHRVHDLTFSEIPRMVCVAKKTGQSKQ